MKKKIAAYALILSLVLLPTLQCGLIVRAAPLLLQGGYALAQAGCQRDVMRGVQSEILVQAEARRVASADRRQ